MARKLKQLYFTIWLKPICYKKLHFCIKTIRNFLIHHDVMSFYFEHITIIKKERDLANLISLRNELDKKGKLLSNYLSKEHPITISINALITITNQYYITFSKAESEMNRLVSESNEDYIGFINIYRETLTLKKQEYIEQFEEIENQLLSQTKTSLNCKKN